MDAIQRALARLGEKERDAIHQILKSLHQRNYKGLDIKKLKGRDDIFRVRKGRIRIIYRVEGERIFILTIGPVA